MKSIEARFQLVTPLFSAGADQGRAELRLPSFKGVLRFWWRALAWSHFGGSLDRIKDAEDDLFGSAGVGGSSRRARVVLRLSTQQSPRQIAAETVLEYQRGGVVGAGARYLGYGVVEAYDRKEKGKKKGALLRACLCPQGFSVHLGYRALDADALGLLVDALKLMGTCGGMGARSRRGFGSLALEGLAGDEVDSWCAPSSIEELDALIARTTETSARFERTPVPYTALSSGSRHLLISARPDISDPLELLDQIGAEMVRYRCFGRGGKILDGESAERERFRASDHDLMQRVAQGESPRGRHPKRLVFGLPHNYFFSSNPKMKQKAEVNPAGGRDRRASPLLVHIHMCGDRPVAVLSLLPSRFLPDDTVEIGVRRARTPVRLVKEDELYQPLHEFLDRLKERSGFERVVEVRR